VVATEVKSLANQTAKATEEISRQISELQQSSSGAADAIGSVTEVVSRISETAVAISAAMEQQSAATAEIARSMQEAALSTGRVSENIGSVSADATATGEATGVMQSALRDLDSKADDLRGAVADFLKQARAA
ncbi:MAG: methyl-accepting chemotaxis protein, partial [Pseudomonadota bacterium]